MTEIIKSFSFKSKTVDGNAGRIEVIHYSNGAVIVNKIITSKDNPFGFKVIREFCGYLVLSERIGLKKETIDIINYGLNNEIDL